MIAALAIVSIALSLALLSLARDVRRSRVVIERLERRVIALELARTPPPVPETEKDPPAPPRRPSQLLN